jgi:hypothetical protein
VSNRAATKQQTMRERVEVVMDVSSGRTVGSAVNLV